MKYIMNLFTFLISWQYAKQGIADCLLSTANEYFPYDKRYHAFWKMYGLDLTMYKSSITRMPSRSFQILIDHFFQNSIPIRRVIGGLAQLPCDLVQLLGTQMYPVEYSIQHDLVIFILGQDLYQP